MRDRVAWLLSGGCACAVLGLSGTLGPEAAGQGAAVQLGLPACGFRTLTGIPCPGCGLTTSFVHLTHGEWVDAAFANPLGVPLWLLAIGAVPVSVWAAVRGVPVSAVGRRVEVRALASLLCVALFTSWLTRVFTTLLG